MKLDTFPLLIQFSHAAASVVNVVGRRDHAPRTTHRSTAGAWRTPAHPAPPFAAPTACVTPLAVPRTPLHEFVDGRNGRRALPFNSPQPTHDGGIASHSTSSSSRGTSTPTTTTVAANATTSLFYSCRCPRRQRRIHERVLASDMLSRLWIWLPVLQRLPTPRASPWHSAPSHVSLFSRTYVMWLWTPAVAMVRNAVLATHRGESVA